MNKIHPIIIHFLEGYTKCTTLSVTLFLLFDETLKHAMRNLENIMSLYVVVTPASKCVSTESGEICVTLILKLI